MTTYTDIRVVKIVETATGKPVGYIANRLNVDDPAIEMAISICHEKDTFDADAGKSLAMNRLLEKTDGFFRSVEYEATPFSDNYMKGHVFLNVKPHVVEVIMNALSNNVYSASNAWKCQQMNIFLYEVLGYQVRLKGRGA